MKKILTLAISVLLTMGSTSVIAEDRKHDHKNNDHKYHNGCKNLPDYHNVAHALEEAVAADSNGLNNDMWATVVDRDGIVCVVA